MRKISEIQNPKLEFRNKVKIRTRKKFKCLTPELLLFALSVFCCFGFRVSRFGFPGGGLGSGFAGLGGARPRPRRAAAGV